MSYEEERATFKARVRNIIQNFERREPLLREEYARSNAGDDAPKELLERATRRFLIDHYLEALGWHPADPTNTLEEARSRGPSNNLLFFDYLGLDPTDRSPVIIIEAKKYGVEPPRFSRSDAPDRYEMAALIAEAINVLREKRRPGAVVAEWVDYLSDMHGYISSLDTIGQASIKRAVITGGRWIIVFLDPSGSFVGPDPAVAKQIECFISFADIQNDSGRLFDLLSRDHLVDTLPLTLEVPHALRFIPPESIEETFRAVLVATSGESGARRRRHPTRSVYAAIVVRSGGRWFAIVDYDQCLEEPRDGDNLTDFLGRVREASARLELRLGRRFGVPIAKSHIGAFDGFAGSRRHSDPLRTAIAPIPGSTADRLRDRTSQREYAIETGEPGSAGEFVVLTGEAHFYKAPAPWGPKCDFHEWAKARRNGTFEKHAQEDYRTNSFTKDGEDRHCAHADMLAVRASRCRIKTVETNMCCRACIFEPQCWSDARDHSLLPCPPREEPTG